MGNKHSHEESDSEEKHHSGTFRDLLKHKPHGSSIPTPKHSSKDDEVNSARRMSSNSSNSSDKDHNEWGHLEGTSPEAKTPSKQDGTTKLAKELMIRSQQEDIKDGISLKVFSKYVCHGSIQLGQALFKDFLKCGKCSKKSNPKSLSKEQFVLGCQKIIQLIGDEKILTFYVQIFSSEDELLTSDDVNSFLQSCYELSLATSSTCVYSDEIAKMFLAAIFHGKSSLSTKYVVHWLEENCPRIVTWMHRHIVHRLTVGHRILQQSREAKTEMDIDFPSNNETPVLDMAQRSSFSFSPSSQESSFLKNYMLSKTSVVTQDAQQVISSTALHPMQVWLLGCTLSPVYTRPNTAIPSSPSVNGICLMDPRAFITRMLASHSPSNWTLLYDSDNDGLSLNRFEHHVMGYRGPTITFLYGDGDRIFCLAVDQAWKESIQFWGTPNSMVIQLVPEYRVLDRGEKLMYYNTSVRGYPFGIQIGTDHRHPCLEIDKELSRLNYRKIPYRLEAMKVWGCGTAQQRESQLEIKKWELKQVEKSRNVKLTAVDWNDHPDKCLLEMASHRPSYSQFGNA